MYASYLRAMQASCQQHALHITLKAANVSKQVQKGIASLSRLFQSVTVGCYDGRGAGAALRRYTLRLSRLPYLLRTTQGKRGCQSNQHLRYPH